MYLPNFEVRIALSVPEMIVIEVLGGVSKPNLRGSGMAPLERALVSSYRLSIVTFSPSLSVSEILPLLCCYDLLATGFPCANRRQTG